MKTRAIADDRLLGCADAAPVLNVQILYEDKPVALRAKQAFDQVADQFRGQENFQVSLWRFDLLQDPDLRQLATRSAASADIILLSTHGWSPLPEAVSSWVIEWLGGRTDALPALVISLDADAKDSATARKLLAGLARVTNSIGVDLIPHYGSPPEPDDPWMIPQIQYRAELMTSVLGDALRHTESHPYRHWGIND